MVRLTLMPISRAPSWSCATARMALPALVSWTIPVSAASRTAVITTTTMNLYWTWTPPMWNPIG